MLATNLIFLIVTSVKMHDCIMLNVFGNFFVNSTNTDISPSHTVHDRTIRGICKGMVRRFRPQEWGLVPEGCVKSPPTTHQVPGVVDRA